MQMKVLEWVGENTDLGRNYLKYGTHEQLRTRREARRREAIQRILEDTQIKTRDVWYYSTVLFLCTSMFLKVVALIVFPFSCVARLYVTTH